MFAPNFRKFRLDDLLNNQVENMFSSTQSPKSIDEKTSIN